MGNRSDVRLHDQVQTSELFVSYVGSTNVAFTSSRLDGPSEDDGNGIITWTELAESKVIISCIAGV